MQCIRCKQCNYTAPTNTDPCVFLMQCCCLSESLVMTQILTSQVVTMTIFSTRYNYVNINGISISLFSEMVTVQIVEP